MGLAGFYLGLAAVAALGLIRILRSQSRSRRYLEAASEEDAPELDHLGRALANLVQDARALRLGLEGPQRQLGSQGRLGAMGSEAEELDSQLREVSRELGQWLQSVERLGDEDAQRLEALTRQPAVIRDLLERERWALERQRRGRGPLEEALRILAEALRVFERDLQRGRDPYR